MSSKTNQNLLDMNNLRRLKVQAFLGYSLSDTEGNKDSFKPREYIHKDLFDRCIRMMRSRGWKLMIDPDVKKRSLIISDGYRYGVKNRLEVSAEIYGTGFRFHFFQNICTVNRNGGKYDFDKYEKMPYLMKKLFEAESNALITEIMAADSTCVFEEEVRPELAETAILKHVQNNHWRSGNAQSLEEIPSFERKSSYDLAHNYRDREKKLLESGQMKYFRAYDGRVYRGRVYHNINNMWWVMLNKYQYTNITSFNLFDATAEDFAVRRKKPDEIPKSRQTILNLIASIPAGALRKEITWRERKQKTQAE